MALSTCKATSPNCRNKKSEGRNHNERVSKRMLVFASVEVVVFDCCCGFLDLCAQVAEAPVDADRDGLAVVLPRDLGAFGASVDGIDSHFAVFEADVVGVDAYVERLVLKERPFEAYGVAYRRGWIDEILVRTSAESAEVIGSEGEVEFPGKFLLNACIEISVYSREFGRLAFGFKLVTAVAYVAV